MNKTWKSFERRVAKALGGKRIPCSGTGEIQGDVLHDKFFIECKYRKKFAIQKWYEEAKEKNKEGKITLIVVKMKNKHNTFVVMDIEDFKKVIGCQ